MGRVKGRKRVWLLEWWRAVGEFKNGERKMIQMEKYRPIRFESLGHALRARARDRSGPQVAKAFVFRERRKPRKITEIQIWDEDYSAE